MNGLIRKTKLLYSNILINNLTFCIYQLCQNQKTYIFFLLFLQKHQFNSYFSILFFINLMFTFLIFCIFPDFLRSQTQTKMVLIRNTVVVVYQCSINNVMYTGDIEALFVLVHAAAVLETHPLLHETYPIITSPWPGLAGSHTLWHSTYKCLSTGYQQVGVWRVCWGSMSIGAVLTARSLYMYARALPLCYTPPQKS